MGLFSSKKKISVSSVVYNLAGDEKDRVQYLPTTVVSGVLSNNDFSMGDLITGSMLSGPGIQMRSFGRWARTSGYTAAIGQTSGDLIVGNNIDYDLLITQIPVPAGKSVSIQTAEVGEADYGFWADQWILLNYPARINDEFELDFTELTNTVYVKFLDVTYEFNPAGFDGDGRYLYVGYVITDPPSEGSIVTGDTHAVASADDYPDTSGWTLNGTVTTPGSMPLEETVHTLVTYSDGRPDEEDTVVTPSTGEYTDLDSEYELETYNGQDPGALDQISSTKQYQHNMRAGVLESSESTEVTEEEIEPGVFKTTTVTTTTESVGFTYSYRIDTQEIIKKGWSNMNFLIYQYGTGNATLDTMFVASASTGGFFPFIPIRMWNKFLSPTYQPAIYDWNVKAYRKAIGLTSRKDYDYLVESIKDNPSIGDIDFSYAMYAVALNTRENSSKKYVYKFFQTMMAQGAGGISEYNNWKVQWAIANNSMLAWKSWKDAQGNSSDPLFGTVEPAIIPYPEVTLKRVSLKSSSMNFNMSVSWSSLEETVQTGLGQAGAKTGDLWWTQGATHEFEEYYRGGRESGGWTTRTITREFVTLNWQDSPTTWRSISMWGLHHSNTVYKGKSVGTSAKSALADPDDTGFLIPLHEDILKSMSLKDSTQMSTACTYIVFNCYTVTKQKWYSSSWFKIVLIVVAIVIAVVSVGTGTGVSAGLLGTAASVGAALGFAGTVAIIVGTIANAIAAMLLTRIISAGATALFGEKVGAIVGAIASVVAISAGTSMATGEGVAAGFSNLASAENIMKLTVATGGGLAEYMGAETADVIKELDALVKEYSAMGKEIADLYDADFGTGQVMLDPMELTDSSRYAIVPENANIFLSRTLLTGSEIADMTNSLLSNFASVTLSTELS